MPIVDLLKKTNHKLEKLPITISQYLFYHLMLDINTMALAVIRKFILPDVSPDSWLVRIQLCCPPLNFKAATHALYMSASSII